MRALGLTVLLLGCAGSVDLSSGLKRVELLDENCGAVATSCVHVDSRIVDFVAGTVEHHQCIEGGAGSVKWGPSRGDSVTTVTLTGDQLNQVKTAVGSLRIVSAEIDAYDGAMTSIVVTTNTSTNAFSPGATCGPSPYNKVVSGFAGLQSTIQGF